MNNLELASEILYNKTDLDHNLLALIQSYFGNLKNSSANFIKEIIKFMYTDWSTDHT